jgi:glycosyltransferase involved in cell wall biosynthesis
MVTGAYDPEISSGGLQCQTMARAIGARASIRILTTAVDPDLPADAVIDEVPVTRVHIDVNSRRSRMAATRRMVAALARLVPASDVIHIHGCSSKNVPVTLAARTAGRPIVLSLHTAGQDEPDAVKARSTLEWWAFRTADRILSVSPKLVDAYLAAGLPAARITLVPNGIDTTRFVPADDRERLALRQSLGLPESRPTIVFVGFFSQDKQPHVLVEAWLQAHAQTGLDATLALVGATRSAYFEVDDGIADRLRAATDARGLGDRLVFAGTTRSVERYLRAADLFVLPSRREGLPVALLEAMACGLPCIASRLHGSTDTIIEDGRTGVLVPAGDVEALSLAMTALLADRPRATALGLAARDAVVRRFSSDEVAARWLDVYRAAVSQQ